MYLFIKRLFDFSIAFFLLIVLLPLLLFLAFLIIIFDKHNPIFIQERPGYRERIFKIIKFRTMSISNKNTKIDVSSSRVTKLGKFLRETSLDELPTLVNILFGEMSFVGPRPLLKDYLKLYSENQKKRHFVLPGLTGLAQVNGRNNISWEVRLNFDVYYVKKISFFMDFKILLKTVKKVIVKDGVNNNDDVTMPLFKGKRNQKH